MERRSRRSRMSLASVVQSALLGLMVAFTFVSPMIAPARAATTHYVNIVDFAFQPSSIAILPGDSVQWNNSGPSPHSTTSDTGSAQAWDSGVLSVGGTYTVTFNNAGSFAYHCSVHSTMHGTVVVGAIPEFSSIGVVMIGLLGLMIGLMIVSKRR